jgi:hypothetical protein
MKSMLHRWFGAVVMVCGMRCRRAALTRIFVRTINPSSVYSRYIRFAFTRQPSRRNNTVKRRYPKRARLAAKSRKRSRNAS